MNYCCCKDVRDQKTIPNSLQNNCFILEDSKDFVYAISTYDLFGVGPESNDTADVLNYVVFIV